MRPARDAAWIGQLDQHGSVDIGLLEGGFSSDHQWCLTKPTTELTGCVEHVATEIHRRSAGRLQRPSRIAVWGAWDAQLDVDLLDVTELAGGDELTEPLIHRMV